VVQRGGHWERQRPAQASPRCTKCNKPKASVPITVLLYNGPLLCSFNVGRDYASSMWRPTRPWPSPGGMGDLGVQIGGILYQLDRCFCTITYTAKFQNCPTPASWPWFVCWPYMVLVVIARVALIGRLFTSVSVEIHWARDAGQPATRIMAVVLSLMPSEIAMAH